MNVRLEKWRWKQLISVNENRRKEGLPPIMQLPPVPETSDEDGLVKTEFFSMDDSVEAQTLVTEESQEMILAKIEELEGKIKQQEELDLLRAQIREERDQEQDLLLGFLDACDRGDEVCEIVLEVEDWKELLHSGFVYLKQMMGNTKEINYRNLLTHHKKLVHEAMARELSEVMQSQALRTVREKTSDDSVHSRCIPMRWLLTWKSLDEFADPSQEFQPGILREDGMAKAKARIVLIGYKHPDLAKKDPHTGKQLLQTASPTLSRLGRNLLLQAAALDRHLLESADAKSAFLQADQGVGVKNKIYTTAVDEISQAYRVPKGTALEIVGAIYGLTNAPRIFWLDTDEKLTRRGGVVHGIDKCIWVFYNSMGQICGRIGVHVDDFLILGNHQDPDWLRIRESIKGMYQWSPWKKSSFVFAGVQLQQLQNFTISLTQEQFCEELRPVTIENEKSRAKDDKLTSKELTQCRGLLMKAQWRAIQSAPQYCARIGIAASAITKETLENLKEANAIVKELKKTSKDGLTFHSFEGEDLTWQTVVFLHFGDAARNNRVDGGDTGGFITGVASPRILEGHEALVSVVDYRSWKLDRPVRGSNGSEAQSLYECEDKGWKSRLFWSLLYGRKLLRGNQDQLAACVESLLITDSRGCYDSLSNNDSPLLGMSNAKTGVELRSVQLRTREGSRCYVTWVPSDLNLADSMTKVSYEAFKVYALYNSRKAWVVKFNSEFVSARKQQKLRQQQGKPKHIMMDTVASPDFQIENTDLSWPSR